MGTHINRTVTPLKDNMASVNRGICDRVLHNLAFIFCFALFCFPKTSKIKYPKTIVVTPDNNLRQQQQH